MYHEMKYIQHELYINIFCQTTLLTGASQLPYPGIIYHIISVESIHSINFQINLDEQRKIY